MTRKALFAAMTLVCAWALSATIQAQDKKDKPKAIPAFDIEELGKKVFHISFPAGEKATIKVKSTDDTDVDLFVDEMDGTEVVKDIDDGKDCLVEFTPLKNKTYRISVINLGPGSNRCTLTHTGKEEKIDFGKLTTTKPFNLAEDNKHTIDVKLQEGKLSAVWVFGEKATDIDLFVYDSDGAEVAKDEHLSKDAFVSFVPKTSGTYRIEVVNLGQGDNTCTVKHTTLEEPKKEEPKKKRGDK